MPAPNSKNTTESGIKFVFEDEFKIHRLKTGPFTTTLAKKDELLRYYKQMSLIRRMELAADALYKAKLIRGFCHLQIGQVQKSEGISCLYCVGSCTGGN